MSSPRWTPQEVGRIMQASADPIKFAEDPLFLGQKLFPMQKEIMEEFYSKNYRELILIAGRQSGKTHLASTFALYETFKLLILDDPAAHFGLAPGSRIFIMCVAVSEKQARDSIFAQIIAKLQRSPFFKAFDPQVYSLEIRFKQKNVTLYCGTSSSASMVGRTVKCIIFDELAKFEETDSKRGAWNVYNSLSRSTVAFGGEGKRISISSPNHVDDIIMTLHHRADEVPDMMSRKIPTWEFNPNIDFESYDMQNELKRDPESFWTDYGCEPLAVTANYFGNPEILKCTNSPNLLDLLYNDQRFDVPPRTYVLAGDPALKHDGFGFALAHLEFDTVIIDGLYRFKDPMGGELSPTAVKDKILRAVDTFHPIQVVFDTWMFPEMQEEIRMKGIPVENHIVNKETYDRVKELFYQDKILVCDYPFVIEELRQLRLIRGKKVDHPKGGSKDVSDSLANCVYLLDNIFDKPQMPLITGMTV